MKSFRIQKKLAVFLVLMTIIGLVSIRQANGGPSDPDTLLTNPGNPHNLSNWATHGGPQAALSGGTDQICIFCHTPHNANAVGAAPLWNRSDPWGGPFPLYGGALAIKGNFGNYGNVTNALYGVGEYPNGASRLCMSCHDGVTAIGFGLLRDGSDIAMTGPVDADGSLQDTLNSVIDLATSHPISFVYSDSVAGQIDAAYDAQFGAGNYFQGPAAFDKTTPVWVPLDGQNRMQCTTCHDPHYANHLAGGGLDPFWRQTDQGGYGSAYQAVCDQCHLGSPVGTGTLHLLSP